MVIIYVHSVTFDFIYVYFINNNDGTLLQHVLYSPKYFTMRNGGGGGGGVRVIETCAQSTLT